MSCWGFVFGIPVRSKARLPNFDSQIGNVRQCFHASKIRSGSKELARSTPAGGRTQCQSGTFMRLLYFANNQRLNFHLR